MLFKDKKVIVTGANRSLGREITINFAREGADVVISYRSDKEGGLETESLLKQNSTKCGAFYADFLELDNIKRFAEGAIDTLGGVDILINNAAMLARETFFEISPEKLQQVFQVNTIAPLYLSQLCAKHMIESGVKGSIVNISSIAGSTTMHKGIGYAASKAAINKWTQNGALNLAEHGIRLNTVAPGVIKSGMNETTESSNPELWQHYLNQIPLNRTGTPEDITNMVMFLASDKAQWITGKVFEIDGGHTLN